ncbi:MAG: SRPBCC domain-containing protein [Dongiaceae bacterium]
MSMSVTDDELFITRIFDVPAATLFALWTRPEHLSRWMGRGGSGSSDVTIDLRIGGVYRARVISGTHGENWFHGVYREIEANRRLVFTFNWENDGPSAGIEMLVTITFEDRDGRTIQTFHQRPFGNAERRDAHRNGWTDLFNQLAAYAATAARENQT